VSRMTTQDFIMTLFCQVDDQMAAVPKRPDAKLYPSEVVTLALLFAIKGVGTRAFYRWLIRDYQAWFPHVPERTRGAFPVFYEAFTLTDLGGIAGSVQRFGQRCHCIWRNAGPASGWHWSRTTRPPNV
jgi:hypothetical protein